MLTTDKSDNDNDNKCIKPLCNSKNQLLSTQHSPTSAGRSMSPTYHDTAPPPDLGNPNMRAPLTATTSITTTSTATTIKSASSVRTRCNLIGKIMINDVGATSERAATAELKTTNTAIGTDIVTAPEEPAAPNNNIVAVAAAAGDFHDNNTSTATIDAGNMINMQRFPATVLMRRATQESKSKLTTAAEETAATATTKVGTLTKRCIKSHESQPAASSAKSESTENKCATKESTTLSYQREVELNRTFSQLELKLDEINCKRTQSKGLADKQQPQLSFAKRNQKLKEDFLADSSEQPDKLEKKNQKLPKELSQREFTSPNWRDDRETLRGPSRKAPQHLKLHIPTASTETQAPHKAAVLEAVLEPPKLSLVARRKLELKRRFEQKQEKEKSSRSAARITTATTTCSHFPSVQKLRQRFDILTSHADKMIVQPNKLTDTASPESNAGNLLALKSAALEQRQSPLSDEGCNLGQSPYSSDEDNVSIRTASTTVERKRKDKVARSASSDSALGLEVDEPSLDAANAGDPHCTQHNKQRRMTLTVTDLPLRPALLPLAEPTALPDSPTSEAPANLLSQATVPSKVLLEERVVEIPEDPRNAGSLSSSRRESAQSCLSDYPLSECGGVRFVRTPSVVVSDYSDDVMCGITLEEIEYFRAQRLRRRRSSLDTASGTEKDCADGGVHSDVSASSSCSNLYYCGSTISALDGAECYVNGMRMPLAGERKASACSICSASGGEEDDAVFSIPEQPEEAEGHLGKDLAELLAAQQLNTTKRPKKPSGWRKIRNIVQWTPFFQTYKKQRYPWVQLAGHQGNFKAGPEQGTVLKKLCPKEEDCFQVLMKDVLRPYVPEYKGQVTSEDGESVYLQLQDLLSDFHQPCVMDCKIGVRTYLEEELSKAKEKPKLRKDMYEKMIQIDPDAPNDEEHKAKGVTKPRYMVWRETISSTATLGFRIEGIKRSDGTSSKDFKTTKSREQIKQAFQEFINGSQHALPRYIQRMQAIRATLECSDFFRTHEVIGSSLLFVHDRTHASVWLIDFAKTVSLPANHEIDHNTTWKVGNHEDGYLIGINNLIELFKELNAEMRASGEAASNELTVSTTSSSNSSSTSLSPMRSVSESNIDEAGAVGGADASRQAQVVSKERQEKEEIETMEKTIVDQTRQDADIAKL